MLLNFELFGLPGSGKSTISKQFTKKNLLSCNEGPGLPDKSKLLQIFLKHPLIFLYILSFVYYRVFTKHNLIIHDLHLSYLILMQYYLFNKSENNLLAEGIVFSLWRYLFLNPHELKNKKWIRQILKYSGPNIIIINVNRSNLKERIINKKNELKYINNYLYNNDNNSYIWNHAFYCYDLLIKILEELNKNIIYINGDVNNELEICQLISEEYNKLL